MTTIIADASTSRWSLRRSLPWSVFRDWWPPFPERARPPFAASLRVKSFGLCTNRATASGNAPAGDDPPPIKRPRNKSLALDTARARCQPASRAGSRPHVGSIPRCNKARLARDISREAVDLVMRSSNCSSSSAGQESRGPARSRANFSPSVWSWPELRPDRRRHKAKG